jgi:hypothetical protein
MQLVNLHVTDAHKSEIIRILTLALERAESGLLEDIAVAAVTRSEDGTPSVWNIYHGEAHYVTLIGAVAVMQRDLLEDSSGVST